jgi:HTH-type transcriptional regulator/antitoxin HigA
MDIKPIRSEEDYEAACKRIDEIFQAESGTEEDDELEILLTLVDAYEEQQFRIEMPDPIEAIEIQMGNLGISRKDLMAYLGKSSGRISDVLNRRRALTLDDVRKLSALLHIPAEVLSQEYPLEKTQRREPHDTPHQAANY